MADSLTDQLFPVKQNQQGAQPQAQVPQEQSSQALTDQLFPVKQKTPQSSFMDAVDAFNARVTNLATGELQMFAQGLEKIGVDTSNFQQRLRGVNQTYQAAGQQAAENSPIAAGVGGAVGDITNVVNTAAQLGPAGASALTSNAGTVGSRVLQSAGLAGAEGLSEYGNAEQRLERGAISGALGLVGQGIAEGVGGILGKLVTKDKVTPGEAGLLNQAEPKTAGMLLQSESAQTTTATLAKMPFGGTRKAVKNAADDIANVANDALSNLGVGKKSTQELGEALVKNIQESEVAARNISNAAYKEAADFATANNIDIPLTTTQKLAQDILQEKTALAQQGFKSVGGGKDIEILQELVNNPEINAKNYESLRKALGARISSFRRGADPDNMAGALTSLKQSMEVDLDAVGEKIGGKYNELLKNARSLYQQGVVPFKQNKILDRSTGNMVFDSDAVLRQAISNDSPTRTAQIMKQLSPDAQKDFSAAIIQKVAEGAKDNAGNIDMTKLATGIRKLGETVDALPGSTKEVVKGLQKFISRGDKILSAAKGGSSIFSPGVGSAGAGSALLFAAGATPMTAILTAAAGTAGLAKMLTSKTISKQLMRLGGLSGKPQDETIKYILKQMFKKSIIPTAASGVAGQKVP